MKSKASNGSVPHAGFEDAPDQEPPGAACQVVHHQHHEATVGDAKDKKVGDQVSTEELSGAENAADRADDQGGNADIQALALQALQERLLVGGEIGHCCRPPGGAGLSCSCHSRHISGGKSLTAKCWLSCKARM